MGRDVVFLLELLAAQIAGEPIGGVGVVLLHVPVEGGLLAAREAADLAPGWGAEQGGIWGGGGGMGEGCAARGYGVSGDLWGTLGDIWGPMGTSMGLWGEWGHWGTLGDIYGVMG